MQIGWYWLSRDKQYTGPVDGNAIVELLNNGTITEKTHFWKEGELANWTRLQDVPHLQEYVRRAKQGSGGTPQRAGSNSRGGGYEPPAQQYQQPAGHYAEQEMQPVQREKKKPKPKKKNKKTGSTGADLDVGGLSRFLDQSADLDQIWVQFDEDESGTIDHDEFRELIYTCIAMFNAYQSESGDINSVPSREELMPTVMNLCDELLPKLDKDNDGEIDREEFNHVGEYLKEQFELLKNASGDMSGGGFGLASAAQQIYQEARVVELHDHKTKKGAIDFFGTQILHYDSGRLVNLGVFDTLTGTVLLSYGLWMKMGCLSIIFTLGAVVTEYGMNPSKIDRDSLQNMLSGLEALLAFFAGLYVQQVLDRWWCIRSEGIGGVCNAVTDLSLTIAGLTHGMTKQERNLRSIIVRYGLLAHALIYARAQDKTTERGSPQEETAWIDLQERGLVTRDEMKILRPLKRQSEAVWGWIISYLHKSIVEDKILPEDRLEHFTEICREGRAASSLVSLHLECQLPLPYVHLIALVINLYQVVLALAMGIICAVSFDQEDDQRLILSVIVFVLYCVIYQGILETADKMVNPLGEDDIDFPQLFIHLNMQDECKAIFETSTRRPWDPDLH